MDWCKCWPGHFATSYVLVLLCFLYTLEVYYTCPCLLHHTRVDCNWVNWQGLPPSVLQASATTIVTSLSLRIVPAIVCGAASLESDERDIPTLTTGAPGPPPPANHHQEPDCRLPPSHSGHQVAHSHGETTGAFWKNRPAPPTGSTPAISS